MRPLDPRITALAQRQHGLISRAQLLELDADMATAYRRADAGHWHRLACGVFAIGGAPQTLSQRIMAAQLAAGPLALISHRTALALWGIRRQRSIPIEVTVPRGTNHRQPGVITHRSGDLDRARPAEIDGIPVTGLARSLLDLGAVEPAAVRRATWAARRSHRIGWDELLVVLVDHARRGRSGVGPLRRVLASHYGEVAGDSATEDLAYAILLDAARVPTPQKHLRVMCADGIAVTADLGWPRHRAVVEIYGMDHFTNEDVHQTDLHRENQMKLAGWSTLTYSGKMLRRQPDQFVSDVMTLLGLTTG